MTEDDRPGAGDRPGPPEPNDPVGELAAAIRASGLVDPGSGGTVLVSGGPDSACLLAGLAAVAGPDRLTALHLNYGLRPESGEDEATAARLCELQGVELVVKRPADRPEGNVQAWAREQRYGQAERLRRERRGEWVAVGHSRSDRAETFLYRLAASPGARGLLGMRARRGRLIRPLLALGRPDLRRIAAAAGLPFVDDRSNLDRSFARVRIRSEVMPVLESINPAVERNIEQTRAELEQDDDLLDRLAAEQVGAHPEGIEAGALRAMDPALRRRALRSLAETGLGRPVPVPIRLADRVLRLALDPEGGRVDAGGGDSFLIESGRVTVEPGREVEAEPVRPVSLPLPGGVRSGGWELTATALEEPFAPRGPEVATLDLDALLAAAGESLTVRRWRPGDRIRPLGMTGRRTVQDLFTDARVPRGRRRRIPVVAAGDEIAWVPGVAVSESFRIGPRTRSAVLLTAEESPSSGGHPEPGSA